MDLNFEEETSGKNQLLTPEQFTESVKLFTDELEYNLKLINQTVDTFKCNKVNEGKNCNQVNNDLTVDNGIEVVNGKFSSSTEPGNSLSSNLNQMTDSPGEKLKNNSKIIKSYNLYLKSLEKSINFRNRGNELFNSKKYSDAIVLYNLAIINGPFDTLEGTKKVSSSVSLALANRSLCHGFLEHLQAAIDDAEAAIAFGYPNVPKVTSRIANYKQRLNQESASQKSIFKTTRDADSIERSKYVLFTDPQCGRGLRAIRQIEPNELILRETAYSCILDYDRFSDFCYNCLAKLTANHFYPCYTCTQVRFCSINCVDKCSYHSYECHFIDLIKSNTNETNLAYRLSLRMILEQESETIINCINQLNDINDLNYLNLNKSNGSNVTDKSTFKSVDEVKDNLPRGYLGLLQLVDHQENQHPLTKVTAFLTAFTFNRRSNFRKTFNSLQLETLLASLFLKHARQVKWNAMSISYRSLMTSDFDVSVNILKEELVGVGIFHIQLLINHSCHPNIKTAKFNGNQVTLSSIETIKIGDEILNSYGMFSKWQGFNYRTEYLVNNYNFNCNCQSCTNQIEPLIRSFRCFNCNGPILIEALEDTSQSTKCLKCNRLVNSIELSKLKKGQITANQTIAAAIKFLNEYISELDDDDDDEDGDGDDDGDGDYYAGHGRGYWGKKLTPQDEKKILMIEQLLHTGHRKLTQVLYKDHRDCIMTLDTIVAFYIRIRDVTKMETSLTYAKQLLEYTKRVFDEDVHLFNTYVKVITIYSFAIKYLSTFEYSLNQSGPKSASKLGSRKCDQINLLNIKSNQIRFISEAINLLQQIIEVNSETFCYFVKYFNQCLK